MSRHVNWLLLNDARSERVTESDIDASEEAAVIDRVLIPLTLEKNGLPAGRNSPYAVTGKVTGKHAWIRLMDEGALIADIAVCLHSRSAPALWERIAADPEMPKEAPWCAVRCYAPAGALPHWFYPWTKTLAMALVRREGW